MGLFSIKETCVICNGTANLTRTNTTIGPVCKECINKLVAHGEINAFNIDKYNIKDLQDFCSGKVTTIKSVSLAKENKKEIASVNEKMPTSQKPLTLEEKLQQSVVRHPTINLAEGEICYYQRSANGFHQKNVVVGSKRSGGGASFRLTKDLTIHSGGGGSETIREDVTELFPGTLYITNMRMVLLAPKYGFDVKLSKINSITTKSNGLLVYVNSKCHVVHTTDVVNIMNKLALIKQASQKEKLKATYSSKPEPNPVDEIREYKKLFDEGIITQTEFEAKKKKILGI